MSDHPVFAVIAVLRYTFIVRVKRRLFHIQLLIIILSGEAIMILGELPRTDNIVISFDIGSKHFDFTTSLLPKVDKDKPDEIVYSEPIMINGRCLKIENSKCVNQKIKYFNQRSGRTHYWKDPEIEYRTSPRGHYAIRSERASELENRRRAIRVPINYRSSCTMSDLEGKYPCMVYDVSVSGVGINIDITLAEKNPLHRLVYTQFKDEVINRVFYITAKVLHTTPLNSKITRCGCEIITVSPSINEYINMRQLHHLAKAKLFDELQEMTVEDVPEVGELPETETKGKMRYTEDYKKSHPISFLSHGDVCPICEKGHVSFDDGVFVCSVCESIIDP